MLKCPSNCLKDIYFLNLYYGLNGMPGTKDAETKTVCSREALPSWLTQIKEPQQSISCPGKDVYEHLEANRAQPLGRQER